ncbi:MAG: Fe-S cluster assembly protein SufD [Microbacteriaceae bacterium]
MSAVSTPTTEQHGARAHSDGGWAAVPVQTRSGRFRSTLVSDFPDVTGREPTWKHTPVDRLAPLLGGDLDGQPYEVTANDQDTASVSWIDRDDARIGSAGMPEDRAAAAAWTSFRKALLIRLSGTEPSEFEVRRDGLGTAPRGAHTVIDIAANSRGTILLRNHGSAVLTENVEILVGDGADVTIVTVQEWTAESLHLASHHARIGRDARLRHIVVSLGGGVVRINPSAHLVSDGGDVELLGLYFADAGQHLEQQVYVDHDAPHTRSRVTYKGALQGAGARSVWVGDVLIRRSATGTDSYEQNRNLVLTDGTRADSIPNLEIETGDIIGAGHASATGRFDDEQLFYLQSRGITEEEARRLVVRGFLSEIVHQIGSTELEKHLQAVLERELSGGVQ